MTVSQIAEKISERKIFPCVFGSALRMEGVKHLLEVMQTFLLEPSYDEVFGAKVFKIIEGYIVVRSFFVTLRAENLHLTKRGMQKIYLERNEPEI